jgi:hypothetical protein
MIVTTVKLLETGPAVPRLFEGYGFGAWIDGEFLLTRSGGGNRYQ